MMNHDDSPTPPGQGHDDASHENMTTTTEAAQLLGYASTKGISQRIQRGRIPGAIKQGNTWLVPVAWVVKEQQQTPTTATSTMKATKATKVSVHHPRQTTKGEEGSSPQQTEEPSEGVATTSPASSLPLTTPQTPLQQYVHGLARLVDKLETLHQTRCRIRDAVYERQRKHDGYYFPQPDESCSTYRCNWCGGCIFYRSKGCPAYDEATRDDYKHAVGQAFYDTYKRKLPLLEYPPCLCHPE